MTKTNKTNKADAIRTNKKAYDKEVARLTRVVEAAEAAISKYFRDHRDPNQKDFYLDKGFGVVCSAKDIAKRELDALVNRFFPVVGEGATRHMYSDATAYTIVSVSKSGKQFKMQVDTATLSADFKPEIHVGGFSGHCSNNYAQSYNYTCNPEAGIVTVRLNKRGWQSSKMTVSSGRHKFYDYNF